MMSTKLRLGMIGGGKGAFIGAVHRIAAQMDSHYELVSGAFSSDPTVSVESGKELGLDSSRCYGSYQEMFKSELKLPLEQRIQVVSIVTPNFAHFEPAKLAMENGFHVILDKPMTMTLKEAIELKKVALRTGKRLCLTHTYTGYPMVKEAKQQISEGKLGTIRKVYVEYPQGWLSKLTVTSGNKQASWRTDPKKSGISNAMGDIGTHAFNLAEYVTGLQISKLNADINTVVSTRSLDDDGSILLKFNNGASGILFATQVASGEENNVKIRVYGEEGGLEWQQNEANTLNIKALDQPMQVYRTGNSYLGSLAKHNTRTPAGHPEGYLEAFANIYRNFALTIKAEMNNQPLLPEYLDFPSVDEGVRGMAFIKKAIESGKSDQKWIDFSF